MEDGKWCGSSGGQRSQDGGQVHGGGVAADDPRDEEGTQGEHRETQEGARRGFIQGKSFFFLWLISIFFDLSPMTSFRLSKT